ncbi:MAG: DUF192 domain-containing protein [Minisyncoccota bacterium]
MKHIKKIILGVVVFIIVVVLGLAYAFVGNKNKIISVKIGDNVFRSEVAESMAQKAKGLSYRDGLNRDNAMYFDFGKEDKYGFWMMGMRFPIDIIWIKNNVVVGIEKNAQALEAGIPENALKVYYPPEAVDRVLEINAGLSDELGIKIGDPFVIIN